MFLVVSRAQGNMILTESLRNLFLIFYKLQVSFYQGGGDNFFLPGSWTVAIRPPSLTCSQHGMDIQGLGLALGFRFRL